MKQQAYNYVHNHLITITKNRNIKRVVSGDQSFYATMSRVGVNIAFNTSQSRIIVDINPMTIPMNALTANGQHADKDVDADELQTFLDTGQASDVIAKVIDDTFAYVAHLNAVAFEPQLTL